MDNNLETRARQQCAVDLLSIAMPPSNIDAAIERYWPVVAVEIAGGLRVTSSTSMPSDFAQRTREYLDIFRRP